MWPDNCMTYDPVVVAIVSPESSIHDAIAAAMQEHPLVSAIWSLREYPDPGQLSQIADAPGGCLVFLDFTDALIARSIAAELDRSYPMAATVAVYSGKCRQDLLELMQLGVREMVTLPTTPAQIATACERAARRLRREPVTEDGASVYAFLPARPGCGATTVAVHSSAAAARLGGQPSLLVDFDLRLGMTSFLLKLHGEQSVVDALRNSRRLDETLWDRLVCRRGGMDILGSAPSEFGRESHEPGAAAGLMDYASQKYGVIGVDLPGEMRDHEVETLHRAKEVFLVCTPDLGALHMAKRKADALEALGLRNRTAVIVNRADMHGATPVRDIEEILGLPARFTVPSADAEIGAAMHRAVPIEGRSAVAGQIERIARRMAAIAGTGDKPAVSRRFIDFFSVTPVRDKAGARR